MFNLCPWGTFGLLFSLFSLIMGIILVIAVTKWARKKGWVGQAYCIALLLSIVFITYACMTYDVKKLKCGCAAEKAVK